MTWCAAVDYRQGTAHRRVGLPCQDFGGVRKPAGSDAIVGAVADGAGSASLSHFGAQSATRFALSLLSDRAARATGPDETLMDGLLEAVQAHLTIAARTYGCDTDDLACTLIAFAAWPTGIAALQIGDGFLIRSVGGRLYRQVGTGHRGEFINETLFVTDPGVADRVRVAVELGPISFIAAATDGLEHVSISSDDGRPHMPFFGPLNDYVSRTSNDDEVHQGIREFLRSERLSTRVDDDMTLLLCGWRDERRNRAILS